VNRRPLQVESIVCARDRVLFWEDTHVRKRCLEGPKILITGGGTGIGKSLGTALSNWVRAEIVMCGRREEVLKNTVQEWKAARGNAVPYRVRYTASRQGGRHVRRDLAGSRWPGQQRRRKFHCRTEQLSPRAFNSVVDMVLHGTANYSIAAGERWIEGGQKGTILSIVTSAAWQGRAFMAPSQSYLLGRTAAGRSAHENPDSRILTARAM
jgi:NAD(P)-dependent dehydrogenase (short-subunit alcohol dehydrogenase family)